MLLWTLRIVINAAALLVFFISPLSDWPWQTWFYAFSAACFLDTLSTFFFVYFDGGWQYETNIIIRLWGRRIGYGTACILRAIVWIVLFYLVSLALAWVWPVLAGLLLFFLMIIALEVSIHNFLFPFVKFPTVFPLF